jgi:hypothetical protein
MILSPLLVDKKIHPIIYNIAVSFDKFWKKFTTLNDNYKKSHILCNPSIIQRRRDQALMDLRYFGQNPAIDRKKLAQICFNDVYREGPVQIEQLNNIVRGNMTVLLNFNLNTYLRLIGTCSNYVHSLKANRCTDSTCLSVGDFLNTFKKGSKKIRNVLLKSGTAKKLEELQVVKKYVQLTDIGPLNCVQLKQIYSA